MLGIGDTKQGGARKASTFIFYEFTMTVLEMVRIYCADVLSLELQHCFRCLGASGEQGQLLLRHWRREQSKLPRLLRNKCARNEAKEAYHPGPTICTTRLLPQHPGKPHRRSGFAGGGFACTRRLVTVVGQRAQQELVHAKVSSSLSPHLHRRACVGRHVHREIG